MGCRQRSVATGCRLAAVLLLAALTGGCGIGIATSSAFGTAFNTVLTIGVGSGATYDSSPPPDPNRRVIEQDCTKPIEDPSANLKCR
jgi:hypothetical protein